MDQQRVLLVGGNYLPEPTGIGKYNGEMMAWIAKEGHDCTVITSYPYYPYWKRQNPYERKGYWFRNEALRDAHNSIRVLRCPHYIPANPTGLNRILSDFSLFVSALVRIFFLLFAKKFDLVIVVAPPFQLGLLGLIYKWIRGAKFVYHIQDLQIDAAKELNMVKSPWLLKLMFRIEKLILDNSTFVSSISEGMIKKIQEKTDRPVIFFPNWVDTNLFYPIESKESLKSKFRIPADKKVVLYSGAIGEKQGLDCIIHAAEELSIHKILFIICGTGPYKKKLIRMVEEKRLNNILFLPLQAKEDFNDFLNLADLHLVLQKANATDLVMPSKLTTILSVGGLALVTANKETSLHNIVSRYNMGLLIEPENSLALTEAILSAFIAPVQHVQMNARSFAKEFLTIDSVIHKFLVDIGMVQDIKPTIILTVNKKADTPQRTRSII